LLLKGVSVKTEKLLYQIQHPDKLDFEAVEVKTVLPKWKRDTTAIMALFGETDFKMIDSKRAKLGMDRMIVFLTYENPWGKSGGIAAVATMLPKELSLSGEKVIRLSPYHRGLRTVPALPEQPLKRCLVSFEGKEVEVAIYFLTDTKQEGWYLFGAVGFFLADGGKEKVDPYVYSDENRAARDGADSKLLRDALFAAKAIPKILQELGFIENLIVHIQDWEFASAVLTVKEALLDRELHSASVVLTLHNPFDHWLSEANLNKITARFQSNYWPGVNGEERNTVLSRMIPLSDAPISTVSRRFAQEFHTVPLQTGHFARHYQQILNRQGILGIDNGLFESSKEYTPEYRQAIEQAQLGNYEPILQEKLKARREMLLALESFLEKNKDRVFGQLEGNNGQPLSDLSDEVPVFLMVGRLDPGQKGFDVLNRFIEASPKDYGRFILSPLSPFADDEEIGKYLNDLKDVAKAHPGEVVVVPLHLGEAYTSLRAGVTWSIWPSLYEPFGGVTEFYIHGTPVIARATGGLVQQVIDYNIDSKGASGILYVEHPSNSYEEQEEEWRRIERTIEPEKRIEVRLYRQQLIALTTAIAQAVHIHKYDKAAYGQILANLPQMHQRLSWQRSVMDYRSWYDKACRKSANKSNAKKGKAG
jgi:glycogen synthase